MLLLLTLVANFGPLTIGALCLQDGVPPEDRRNISVDGISMPLGIVSFSWTSSLIEGEIFRIITEEWLGFHTDKVLFSDSSHGYYLVAGCTCGFAPGGCFRDPQCYASANRWHISIGSWYSYHIAAMKYVAENHPEQVPTDLGNLGYPAWDGAFIAEHIMVEAFNEAEVTLEYYREYNTSQNLTQFFASVSDIPLKSLRPCNLSTNRFTNSREMGPYARWTGDWDGVTQTVQWDGSPAHHANCKHLGHWWLAPSCRHDVRACIPTITGGDGWSVSQLMFQGTSYGLPLAIAVAASWDDYVAIPHEFRTLFYFWYPESLFSKVHPVSIIFPEHNEEEWAEGYQRTATNHVDIKKYAWHGLGQVRGEVFSEVARRIRFTKQSTDRLLTRYVEVQETQSWPTAEVATKLACDWLLENQETWDTWVPTRTNCLAGQGLVQDVDVLGSFVHSRAEARGCQWCPTGRYSSALPPDREGETRACVSCPPGQDQSFSGQTECTACVPGRFKANTSAGRCEECAPGRATHRTGQPECPLCPRGRANAQQGELHCVSCSNGTAAEEEGQLRCYLCTAGRYATAGGRGCASCDLVLAGSTSIRGSASAQECLCPPGTYTLAEVAGCLPCPAGLDCPGGNGPPLQKAGYWVDVSGTEESQLGNYAANTYKCRDELQCPAGRLGGCAENRSGRACNNCQSWHYAVEDGSCKFCGSGSSLPFWAFTLLLPLLLLLVLLLLRGDATKQHLSVLTAGCIIGQVVTCVQALSAIQKVRVDFPAPLSQLFDIIVKVTSFDFLRLPCVITTNTPVTSFTIALLAYPIFVILLASFVGILKILGRPFDVSVASNANCATIMVAYITMTLHVVLPFQCQDNPGGFLSMVSEPGLKCFEDAHHIALSVLGAVGVLAYPVAISAWVAYATLRYRLNIHSAEGLRTLRGYRFLFSRFRPERYYFAVVLLVRNSLVAIVPVLLVRLPGLQVLLLVLVLLVGSILQAKFWPWRTEAANITELFFTMTLTIAAAGVGFLLPGGDPEMAAMLGWTVVIFLLLLQVFAALVLLKLIFHRWRPSKPYGIFLCHHKVGAGVLCRLLKTLMASGGCTPIFLDSDHLHDLDTLFDIVRSSVSNLVVVLSQKVLLRPWCAGEIVTAHRNGIPITALICEDFSAPTESDVLRFVEDWTTAEFSPLAAVDITRQMVSEVFCHLLCDANIQRVHLSRFQDLVAKQETVMRLARSLGQVRGRVGLGLDAAFKFSAAPSQKPVVLVTGAVFEGEWLVACELMKVLLEWHLEVETEVLRDFEEFHEQSRPLQPTVKIVVILLSQGLLRNPGFARTLMAILEPPEGSSPHLLTALADSSFQFPGADFFADLEKAGMGSPDLGPAQGPSLAAAYYTMLSLLSRPFTPLASAGIIQEQVAELSDRAQQLIEQRWQSLPGHVASLRSCGSTKRIKKHQASSTSLEVAASATPPKPLGEAWVGEEWAETSCYSKGPTSELNLD